MNRKYLTNNPLWWQGFSTNLIRLTLAFVFLVAGIIKLVYTQELVGVLEVIGLTPLFINVFLGLTTPIIEIVVGILLLFKWKYQIAISSALFLISVFWIVSLYGLAAGLEDDCACFGPAVESHFGWWMAGRNTLLLFLCGYLFKTTKKNAKTLMNKNLNKGAYHE